MRALREAAAHILVSVLVSMLITLCLGAVANIDVAPGVTSGVAYWFSICLGAIGVAGLGYLSVALIIVVNLLWDAYEQAGADSSSQARS